MVIVNRRRETAIVITAGRVWTTCVFLRSGRLHVGRLSKEEMSDWRPLDYPVARAIERYLQHSGGVSDAVRRILVAMKERN